jgi:hypothetical protein
MTSTLDELVAEGNKHVRVELTRLSREVAFIDEIDTTVDSMIGAVVEGVYTKISPVISSYTNLPEDKEELKSLIYNAVYKSVNPSILTGISDIINRRPGEIVGQMVGKSGISNLISSISNRVGSLVPSGVSSVVRGTFSAAEEISEAIHSPADQIYNTIFNVTGLNFTMQPGIIPELARNTLDLFSSNGGSVIERLQRFSDICQVILDDCTALDSTYYSTDQFTKTRDAQESLDYADQYLVNVRSKLIYSSTFDGYRYGLAKQNVQDAADILADNGNPVNRINEILGGSQELDYIIVDLDNQYNATQTHLENLKVFMPEFRDNFSADSALIGVLNNIQSEIRSIILSMDGVLAKAQPSIMPYYERRWWIQLLALIEKMSMIPASVDDYFTTDPDGYIYDYNTNIADNLDPISLSDLTLLQGQLKQLKYHVGKKLDSNVSISSIAAIVSQILSDNNTRMNAIAQAISIAGGYAVKIGDMTRNILSLFKGTGMDRAYDMLTHGDWKTFFTLDIPGATYLGQLEKTTRKMINEVRDYSYTVDGLAALQEVHTFIRNQKRSRDVLATTFTSTKDLALGFKVNEEIPSVQRISSKIDRFRSEMSNG